MKGAMHHVRIKHSVLNISVFTDENSIKGSDEKPSKFVLKMMVAVNLRYDGRSLKKKNPEP